MMGGGSTRNMYSVIEITKLRKLTSGWLYLGGGGGDKTVNFMEGKPFLCCDNRMKSEDTLEGKMQSKFLNVQDGSACSNHILYGDQEHSGGSCINC
jgi:hypothetical protein